MQQLHHANLSRHAWSRRAVLAVLAVAVALPTATSARSLADSAPTSTFNLFVNPGLAAGKPFACPAMQNASAQITVTNRFVADALNDVMTLTATGLPPKTAFDVFLVEHSPISNTAFAGFGKGWYQSDLNSDDNGQASITVQGIFDQETFIEDPSAPFSPVHTFDVGFWFNSPADEQRICGNATAPAPTPFNGEQNAGLLAMITQGEPLQLIANAAPGAGVNAPAQGSIRYGVSRRIVTTCTDPYGWTHIRSIDWKLVSGKRGRATTPLALWAQYDQNAELIRLFDPRTHSWHSGRPGSHRLLSNGFVTLDLAHTQIRSAGRRSHTVQVIWQVTFTQRAIANNYRQMLRIVDDFGATRGWKTVGSWSVLGGQRSQLGGSEALSGLQPHAVSPSTTNGYYDTPTPTSQVVPPTATPSPTATTAPAATSTPVPPAATNTPQSSAPTNTPAPPATNTPLPPATNTPVPAGTATPIPPCSAATCTFSLGVNPGLLPGKPFACPAIQNATASITIANRFPSDAPNDTMTLTATGLPPNTGFDMFLVENSPLDGGAFNGFGFGWYQSDVQSDGNGQATVTVKGIFDKETFIENPANGLTPTHTYNVGFWFNSPAQEQQVCGNATAPAITPFNGEQNAGLLAMITVGKPLQVVQ